MNINATSKQERNNVRMTPSGPPMNAATLDLAPPEAPVRHIPGNKGIWVGITCEFVEFAVLFAVYFIARAHFPDAFHEGAQRLNILAGTSITLLMITSSYCIACSVNAVQLCLVHC